MLRMAHRILATREGDFGHHPDANRDSLSAELESIKVAIRQSIVVCADNIADWYATSDKSKWNGSDFPCLRPQFESMLIEWNNPSEYLVDGKWEPSELGQSAVLITGGAYTDEHRKLNEWINPRTTRLVGLKPLFQKDGHIMVPRGEIHLHIDDAGCIIEDFVFDRDGQTPEDELSGFGHIAMAAISFMNCKNVIRRDITAEVGPPPKWIRRQKAPTIRYHVLDINPMKDVLRTEGGIEHNGLKKALHICRGHFAHYENGLFGRGEACTIWKPSHVRGQAEQGIVLKDYRIKTNS